MMDLSDDFVQPFTLSHHTDWHLNNRTGILVISYAPGLWSGNRFVPAAYLRTRIGGIACAHQLISYSAKSMHTPQINVRPQTESTRVLVRGNSLLARDVLRPIHTEPYLWQMYQEEHNSRLVRRSGVSRICLRSRLKSTLIVSEGLPVKY